LAVAVGLLVGLVPAGAAPAYLYTPDFVTRTWQSAEGMPENSATSIAQTPDGYLWVGTFSGLTRFDGTELELITDPAAGLTPTAGVVALKVTQDGRLWVSSDRGIFVLAQKHVLPGVGQAGWPKGEIVRSWTESAEGLLAATFSGLCLRFDGLAWRPLPEPGTNRAGFTVETDLGGNVWSMKDGSAYRWRDQGWQVVPAPEPTPLFRGLCRRREGGVWLLSTTGAWRADADQLTLERPGQRVTMDLWSTREDSRGRIWLAGLRQGLDLFLPDGRTQRLTRTNGLTSDSLRLTFEDRDGSIWLGSSGGGLMRFRDRRFTGFADGEGLPVPAINQLRFDRAGRLVVATQGGGIATLRGDRFELFDAAQSTNHLVFAHATLEESPEVWWAAYDAGLFRREGGNWTHIRHPRLGPRAVRSLHLDRNRQVWAACVGGVATWRRGEIEFIPAPNEAMTIEQLLDDPGGGLFVTTSDRGLWHLDPPNGWQPLAPESLGEQGIYAMYPLGNSLWLATSGLGLARWQAGQLSFVKVPGLDVSAPVLSLVDDALGNLWLGTRRGLMRLPLTEAEATANGLQEFAAAQTFGPADGVTSLEFRRNHQPTAVRAPDGTLWFGTVAGLVRFDPTRFGPRPEAPAAAIRQVSYFAPPHGDSPAVERLITEPPPEVTLPHGSALMVFDYLGLDFAAPELLRYRVRLWPEGAQEPPWQETAELRASFPFVPTGRYRFQVTPARLGEPWSRHPQELRVEILPAWWERRPVQVGGALGLAGLFSWGGWALLSFRTRDARRRLEQETRLLDERREAERQNRLLRELLDQSADSVFVLELPDGVLVDASASVARQLGLGREQWATLTPAGLGLLPPATSWDQLVTDLRLEPRKRFETELRPPDGRPVPVEVAVRLSQRDGREFVLAIARDISDRRASAERQSSLERQLRESQKLEAVGRLAGGIAHDFNNLLQIIGGFTDIVRQDPDMNGATREEHLAEVSRAAVRASDLTRQLLAFSRREAVEMHRCDLGQTVREALKMLRPLVGAHVRIELDSPPQLPPILADVGQLNQVLLNLAANARDAMPDGGDITLTLRALELPADPAVTPPWALPGQWVELTFADSGAGIPADRLGRIFEPFFTTKERGKGTGLGLAVVYGVVQQHQAQITVESTPKVGTTFRLRFPVCALPAGLGETTPGAASPAPPPDLRRILIVDDETVVLQLAERVLAGAGHLVYPTTDGPAAVRTFAANADAIDLVVLDVLMPGMTGWVVAREIRSLRPGVPILFCSGYATEEVEREIAGLPRSRLLLKPFTPTQLLVEVQLLASQHPRPGR
jgi:PAS domain S-box-containing protein